MSVPQTPQAATLISTSPGPTSGTGTSSTRTTPLSRYTPARMVLGIGPSVRTESRAVALRVMTFGLHQIQRRVLSRYRADSAQGIRPVIPLRSYFAVRIEPALEP